MLLVNIAVARARMLVIVMIFQKPLWPWLSI
uniref:Uncharacterized protein n=1 Tax=Nymphaea colorata TaxID=210225 RepID=A0A5K1DB01_9MAGN